MRPFALLLLAPLLAAEAAPAVPPRDPFELPGGAGATGIQGRAAELDAVVTGLLVLGDGDLVATIRVRNPAGGAADHRVRRGGRVDLAYRAGSQARLLSAFCTGSDGAGLLLRTTAGEELRLPMPVPGQAREGR